MFQKIAAGLVVLTVICIASHTQLRSQVRNPLVGGLWDRYSIRDAKGAEIGVPGYFYLTFTDNGYFFVTAVPDGKKLSKPIAEMTRDDLVRQFDQSSVVGTVRVRRGKYTVTGTGPVYTLILTDEVSPFLANIQGSCPASSPCQFRMVDGEVHLGDGGARWRRVN